MEIMVLGIGGMMPMPGRFLASAVLRHNGRTTLFDCGEGPQVPLKESGWGVGHIDRIALTHLHADHVTGVPGMLMLLAQVGPRRPLDILGLPPVCDYVRGSRQLLDFHMEYDLHYHDLGQEGGVFQGDGFKLTYRPLDHRGPVLGFRYEEDERLGRFEAARADALGIPDGPERAALQRGETISVEGNTITSDMVIGPARRGRRFGYITDTRPCDAAGELLENCDVAVIEGMFQSCHSDEAVAKKHMTSVEAATLAAEAGVGTTLLTHVSTRYSAEDLVILEQEAACISDRIKLAQPLHRYPIPLPD